MVTIDEMDVDNEIAADEAAVDIVSNVIKDEVVWAIDRLGWALVPKRPLEPGEAPPKWPIYGPSDYCPDWCEPRGGLVKPRWGAGK